MSDFLIIAPEDPTWLKFNDEQAVRLVTEVLDPGLIIEYSTNDLFNLSLVLVDTGLLQEDQRLTAARLISTGNSEVPYQFWYKL